MPLGPLLYVVFPPYQTFEALVLPALHLIVVTSYHVSFLPRRKWNKSFYLATGEDLSSYCISCS